MTLSIAPQPHDDSLAPEIDALKQRALALAREARQDIQVLEARRASLDRTIAELRRMVRAWDPPPTKQKKKSPPSVPYEDRTPGFDARQKIGQAVLEWAEPTFTATDFRDLKSKGTIGHTLRYFREQQFIGKVRREGNLIIWRLLDRDALQAHVREPQDG